MLAGFRRWWVRTFKPDHDRLTHFSTGNLDLDVPAGATDEAITVAEDEPDLTGFRLPRGFIVVGKVINFGPNGTHFKKGKELHAKFRIDPARLQGHPISAVRLYYINTETKQLELVPNQYVDPQQFILEAKLTHFSSYIPGIEPAWNGSGLNPFMDYVNNGEEHFSISNLSLTIMAPVYSIKSKGMAINLTRMYTTAVCASRLAIAHNWYWALPIVADGGITLSNGTKYDFPYSLGYNESGAYYYDFGAVKIKAVYKLNSGNYGELDSVYLNDGTKFQLNVNSQTVTDPNGNWIQYVFSNYRIYQLTDSAGHKFYFNYETVNYEPVFQNVVQVFANGTRKTILTLKRLTYSDNFIDALGRSTIYEYYTGTISKITYPNGLVSSYGYSGNSVYQTFTRPGSSTVARTVTYTPGYTWKGSNSGGDVLTSVTVKDGTCTKIYRLTDASYIAFTTSSPVESPGYTKTEETYTNSGKLVKRINYNYKFIKNRNGDYEYVLPLSITTTLAKADGSPGASATYEYTYDDWGNTTMIKDPYATTLMAYANTNSNKCLSQLNSGMRDYRSDFNVPSTVPWNRLLTKAVIVEDPVHGTQLNQIHYKYDAAGNLTQESVIYNSSSYLDTYYTYDSFGNMLSKTDANGNQICYEYSPKYKSTYLTRVYNPQKGTIATYDYGNGGFEIGKPTTITDPNNNTFNYTYDAVGRLTGQTLVNSGPKVGVTRRITYNDTTSQVKLDFGNDSSGWQHGQIYYDPVFGKPATIGRQKDGSWVKIKEFSYDSNGRLASEKDNMGHTTYHNYDELDRESKTTFPDNTYTTYTWDERTQTITDANQNQKTNVYDLLDRLIAVYEHPDANTTYTTIYDYDSEGHLVRVINPLQNIYIATINTYDNLGRLIRVDYPQDGANPIAPEIYTYDAVGNLKTKSQGQNSKTIDYEFFSGYRIKTVTTQPDGKVVNYTYDNNDNILSQSIPDQDLTYTYSNYDARNRAHNFTAQMDGNTFNISYDYDVFGRETSITYPGRTNPVNYNYDELDRLIAIPGFVNSCSYDEDSKLTGMMYSNGVNNSLTYRQQDDRLSNITIGSLLNLNYSYDNVGNITQINTIKNSTDIGNDFYSYDGLNRLTWAGDQSTADTGNGTVWTYDAAGNMNSKISYVSSVNQGTTSFSYDLANRLWSMGTKTYTNDAAGNRTGKNDTDSWIYIYDLESRLTQVTKNGTDVLDNTYDGSGMRVKQVSGAKTTYYVYLGNSPIMEYSASDGKYTYFIYAGNKLVAEEKDGVVKYYHQDHLGSTRLVTDASRNVVATYKYKPYGEVESHTGEDIKYGFTGKEEDSGTGLKYFGARWYDPETGRFITQDPYTNLPNDQRLIFNEIPLSEKDKIKEQEKVFSIGFGNSQEYNRYAYCCNNRVPRQGAHSWPGKDQQH